MDGTLIAVFVISILFWVGSTIWKVATDNLYLRKGRRGHGAKWYPEEDYGYTAARWIIIGFGSFMTLMFTVVLIFLLSV